jgi:hypothetical protein
MSYDPDLTPEQEDAIVDVLVKWFDILEAEGVEIYVAEEATATESTDR